MPIYSPCAGNSSLGNEPEHVYVDTATGLEVTHDGVGEGDNVTYSHTYCLECLAATGEGNICSHFSSSEAKQWGHN
jgi:hypothetical protein